MEKNNLMPGEFNLQFCTELNLWKLGLDKSYLGLNEVYFEGTLIDDLRTDEVWQSLIEEVPDSPATLSCNFSLAFCFSDNIWELEFRLRQAGK